MGYRVGLVDGLRGLSGPRTCRVVSDVPVLCFGVSFYKYFRAYFPVFARIAGHWARFVLGIPYSPPVRADVVGTRGDSLPAPIT